MNRLRSCLAAVLALLLLPGCSAGPRATAAPRADTAPDLARARPLPGAGAVAFDAASAQLAWADGAHVQVLDLAGGNVRTIATEGDVSDLGYARDDLWIVAAGHVERRRGGALVCRSREADLQRLLGVDAEGIAAAGYAYADGIGPTRHQVWLDGDCRLQHESTAPLPAGVTDAEADPGAVPSRASLRSPHALPEAATRQSRHGEPLPEQPASAPVAASPDGRWWVFGESGRRELWRTRAER